MKFSRLQTKCFFRKAFINIYHRNDIKNALSIHNYCGSSVKHYISCKNCNDLRRRPLYGATMPTP